jgi:pyridoxal phosphate enzyme (YggS family)
VASVRDRIRRLAGDRTVHLIAVTKGFGADAITAAGAAGCTMVGENYAQEVVAKLDALRGDADGLLRPDLPAVHFIGRLQTNKVRLLTPYVSVWQSVDRPALATEIAKRAPGATVFVQVNTTAEPDKGGCAPADVERLVTICRDGGLIVDGLMTVGPTSQDRAITAAAFAQVRAIADDLELAGCSMGMSADMDEALAHGATHVRIGSALFGSRPQRRAPIG